MQRARFARIKQPGTRHFACELNGCIMWMSGIAFALAGAAVISLIRLSLYFSKKLAELENRLSQLEAQADHHPTSA